MSTVPNRYDLHITYHLTWGISTAPTALDAPETSQIVSQPTMAPATPLQAVTRPAEAGTQASKEHQGHSDHTTRGGSLPLHRLQAFPTGNSSKAGYVENNAGSQRAILNIINASHYLPDGMTSVVLSQLAQYIAVRLATISSSQLN